MNQNIQPPTIEENLKRCADIGEHVADVSVDIAASYSLERVALMARLRAAASICTEDMEPKSNKDVTDTANKLQMVSAEVIAVGIRLAQMSEATRACAVFADEVLPGHWGKREEL